MPEEKTLSTYFFETLQTGGWPGIELDESKKLVTCPEGEVLKFSRGCYALKFFSYSENNREYYEKEKYGEIVFPENFDIKKYLYFRNNGNYDVSKATQFKKVINPLNREVKKIKLISGRNIRRFQGSTLSLSIDIWKKSLADAEKVYKRKNSYASSVENYLSNLASGQYGRDIKKKTTSIEKGEFSFVIDRLNLGTKKKKKDFEKYLDDNDLSDIENLLEVLIKKEVLSPEFLRRLNDYFIKERLEDILKLGRAIIDLKSTNLKTKNAKAVQKKLGVKNLSQLETLWQKYFEDYLLYLIFSYKKIFPKIQLKNIDGDKKYPDFVGVNHYNGLDVVEIKTHLKNAFAWDSSHENFYFSAEMSKAIVQTMNYIDAISQEKFQKPTDRQKITNFTDEENLHHPRGIIIISSLENLATKKDEPEKLKRDFTKLRNSIQNVQILTFDEILNIAEEYISNIIE